MIVSLGSWQKKIQILIGTMHHRDRHQISKKHELTIKRKYMSKTSKPCGRTKKQQSATSDPLSLEILVLSDIGYNVHLLIVFIALKD